MTKSKLLQIEREWTKDGKIIIPPNYMPYIQLFKLTLIVIRPLFSSKYKEIIDRILEAISLLPINNGIR